MKRGPLNATEKKFIEQNYKSQSVAELAKNLDRREDVIQRLVNEMPKEEKNEELTVGNLMVGKNGVKIMTPAASELGDATRKTGGISKLKGCIHKIK